MFEQKTPTIDPSKPLYEQCALELIKLPPAEIKKIINADFYGAQLLQDVNNLDDAVSHKIHFWIDVCHFCLKQNQDEYNQLVSEIVKFAPEKHLLESRLETSLWITFNQYRINKSDDFVSSISSPHEIEEIKARITQLLTQDSHLFFIEKINGSAPKELSIQDRDVLNEIKHCYKDPAFAKQTTHELMENFSVHAKDKNAMEIYAVLQKYKTNHDIVRKNDLKQIDSEINIIRSAFFKIPGYLTNSLNNLLKLQAQLKDSKLMKQQFHIERNRLSADYIKELNHILDDMFKKLDQFIADNLAAIEANADMKKQLENYHLLKINSPIKSNVRPDEWPEELQKFCDTFVEYAKPFYVFISKKPSGIEESKEVKVLFANKKKAHDPHPFVARNLSIIEDTLKLFESMKLTNEDQHILETITLLKKQPALLQQSPYQLIKLLQGTVESGTPTEAANSLTRSLNRFVYFEKIEFDIKTMSDAINKIQFPKKIEFPAGEDFVELSEADKTLRESLKKLNLLKFQLKSPQLPNNQFSEKMGEYKIALKNSLDLLFETLDQDIQRNIQYIKADPSMNEKLEIYENFKRELNTIKEKENRTLDEWQNTLQLYCHSYSKHAKPFYQFFNNLHFLLRPTEADDAAFRENRQSKETLLANLQQKALDILASPDKELLPSIIQTETRGTTIYNPAKIQQQRIANNRESLKSKYPEHYVDIYEKLDTLIKSIENTDSEQTIIVNKMRLSELKENEGIHLRNAISTLSQLPPEVVKNTLDYYETDPLFLKLFQKIKIHPDYLSAYHDAAHRTSFDYMRDAHARSLKKDAEEMNKDIEIKADNVNPQIKETVLKVFHLTKNRYEFLFMLNAAVISHPNKNALKSYMLDMETSLLTTTPIPDNQGYFSKAVELFNYINKNELPKLFKFTSKPKEGEISEAYSIALLLTQASLIVNQSGMESPELHAKLNELKTALENTTKTERDPKFSDIIAPMLQDIKDKLDQFPKPTHSLDSKH